MINIDKHYLYKIEDFEFCEDLFDVLKIFISYGYILIIVTNQSGIGRGYYSNSDFEKLTTWMLSQFSQNGILISKVYYCPHVPEDLCDCRKPKPKMFLDAQKEFNIDISSSWMIGDKESDILAARAALIDNTILLSQKSLKTEARYCVKSIFDTLSIIK